MTTLSPAVPALRWSDGRGYDLDAPRVRAAMEAGAPGFILFGGSAEEAGWAARELTRRSGRPLLLGADLERGAGQQFRGATPLPPLAALGALGEMRALWEAGALTAREAVSLGIPWIFAPVADLALEPENPIVATRALGNDPGRVAAQVEAWVQGCLSAGGIPCVKHFPGHGRTLEDSHAVLPVVGAPAADLRGWDLIPFARAVSAGVPSVMTAHVSYPSLDPSGAPATRSRPVVEDLLRGEMGFGGVVVTDALIMEGAGEASSAVVEALAAGVDLLLYPPDDVPVEELVREALGNGRLDPGAARASALRVDALVRLVPDPLPAPRWGAPDDLRWARELARRVLGWSGGPAPVGRALAVTVVDDDVGGPYPPPSREPFLDALRDRGVSMTEGAPFHLLCLYAEPRAWKGRAGLSPAARKAVERWAAATEVSAAGPGGRLVAVFGGPRVAAEIPDGIPTLVAWGGETLMQEAAAAWIVDRGREAGS